MISPHWDTMDRWAPGLRQLVSDSVPDGLPHLGLEEHTAAVGDGRTFRVLGEGRVVVRASDRPETDHAPGGSFSLPGDSRDPQGP
jgi:hypothetical protein